MCHYQSLKLLNDMKKILVFGGTSLLGQYLIKSLEESSNFLLYTTVRNIEDLDNNFYKPETEIIQFEFSKNEIGKLDEIIKEIEPAIIINCIALLNKKEVTSSEMIFTNSFLPQYINEVCRKNLTTYFFIQISSDAVFKGKMGDYSESSSTIPLNFYGLTKLTGEINDSNCLNIRTSFYGPNLLSTSKNSGFFDWIVKSTGVLSGYKNYFFSGLSTIRLADEIKTILLKNELRGTVHIAAQKISKLELLLLINNNSNKKEVVSCEEPRTDLTLISDYRLKYPATHEEMVHELFTFKSFIK